MVFGNCGVIDARKRVRCERKPLLRSICLVGWAWCLACVASAFAQHEHGHVDREAPLARPRVFLDKSPRVVAYQLKRLSNERLLLVERRTDDPKFAPVYKAILLRAGMSPQYRAEALEALTRINGSTQTDEVLAAIGTLNPKSRQEARSARDLALMLLDTDSAVLAKSSAAFEQATHSENQLVRHVGYAGLMSADRARAARGLVNDDASAIDFLDAVALVPAEAPRNQVRLDALEFLDDRAVNVRKAAIRALASMTEQRQDTFRRLAPFVSHDRLRTPTVRTLLRIPGSDRDARAAENIVDKLVRLAESTPADQRTTEDFTDAMRLADQLLGLLTVELARSYRGRLREVTVRVVQIHTIEEEMRYDISYFVVEAGRPVQVVLKNEDLMPHNLVITTQGNLEKVADLGLAAGPNGHEGKQYVPDSELILFATNMVPPAASERLTFTAPTEPGEYPYVCTFPRHWMRMYGVMLVVEDLDAWLQNPVEPKDPLGSTRAFVQNWKVEDFDAELSQSSLHATTEAGKQLFAEATCALCHKANGEGGAVGPALNGVSERWKGDRAAILREILDPSHRIDPKYAVHLIITAEGETISGIVPSEDKKTVSVLANPESTELIVVQRDDIEDIVKTSTSMMPKGLLDRFQKHEVLEILAYLEALESP